MPLELQALHTKEKETPHKKKGLQPSVRDSVNIDPRPSKKRRRDETETEIVSIKDKNERKRRKKEDKTKERALAKDVQPITLVQGPGPTIIGTLEGKSTKAKKQKDARKVEEPLAKGTGSEKPKEKERKRKTQMTSGQRAAELQEPANGTNKDKIGRKKVKHKATKRSPHDQEDEREVEKSLNVSDLPVLDALGITRDTADEDILRAVVIGPSQPAHDVIVSGAKPAKRQATQLGSKKRASSVTTIAFEPEAQLASKWLSSAQVKQIEKDTGIVVKKGRFTTSEEVAIRDTLDSFRGANGLSREDIVGIIHSEQRAKYGRLWQDLAAAVPLRPLAAVYSYCKRAYHPLCKQGKWTEEEDEKLLAAVHEVGHIWEQVSTHVGRFATDCRDRYKNHLSERDRRNTGAWTEAEEQELIRIVREVQEDQGKDYDDHNDILWSTVSARMGGRRGRQQVRDKWLNQLRSRVQNEIEKIRWTDNDSVTLLRRLISLKLEEESEIDWNALSDDDWNLWSAHTLQRHWAKMKKGVEGHKDRTFSEILRMVNFKHGIKPSGRKRATRDSTSKKATRGEYKELTLSKGVIEDSDEGLAPLDG